MLGASSVRMMEEKPPFEEENGCCAVPDLAVKLLRFGAGEYEGDGVAVVGAFGEPFGGFAVVWRVAPYQAAPRGMEPA